MVNTIGEFKIVGTGDIGGSALSRFHVTLGAGTSIDVPTANAVGAAIKGLYSACAGLLIGSYSWQVQGLWQEFDVSAGTLLAAKTMSTIPSVVGGAGSPTGVAGNGARAYWHTSTVLGRRFMRGATFITPFASNAYTGTGGLTAAAQTTVQAAMAAYIAAINTAGATPVVWHRPKPPATDGVVGAITAGSCGVQPGSVRSRRS